MGVLRLARNRSVFGITPICGSIIQKARDWLRFAIHLKLRCPSWHIASIFEHCACAFHGCRHVASLGRILRVPRPYSPLCADRFWSFHIPTAQQWWNNRLARSICLAVTPNQPRPNRAAGQMNFVEVVEISQISTVNTVANFEESRLVAGHFAAIASRPLPEHFLHGSG